MSEDLLALGVTRAPPEEGGGPALLVRDEAARSVPRSLEIDGEHVRVVVDAKFRPPTRQ